MTVGTFLHRNGKTVTNGSRLNPIESDRWKLESFFGIIPKSDIMGKMSDRILRFDL